MKILQVNAALTLLNALFLPKQSIALRCGINGVTKSCIGDTDPRYSTDASNNLVEQDEFWRNIEGLYFGTQTDFSPDGEEMKERDLGTDGTYDFSDIKIFANWTIDGSRLYVVRYSLIKHNGNSAGIFVPAASYFTSSYEKNGEAIQLATVIGSDQNFAVAQEPYKLLPISERAILAIETAYFGDVQESTYCVDPKCNKLSGHSEVYTSFTTDLIKFSTFNMEKVTEDNWVTAFITSTDKSNITAIPGFNLEKNISPGSFPDCPNPISCPTEGDWKSRDPVFGTSVYVEPDGVLEGGFIAGITVASIVVACLIFYAIHRTLIGRALRDTTPTRTTGEQDEGNEEQDEGNTIELVRNN